VTTDIDGDLRSTTAPDMGADEFTPLANDLQVTQLLVPGNNSCGDSNSVVALVVRNLGTAAQSNFGVGVNVSGAATANLTSTFTGTLASLAADTVQLGTVNTVVGGTFNFTGYVALANDGKTSNDTLVSSRNHARRAASHTYRISRHAVCGRVCHALLPNDRFFKRRIRVVDDSRRYLGNI